jgi:hypothetical protein
MQQAVKRMERQKAGAVKEMEAAPSGGAEHPGMKRPAEH